MIEGVLLDMDGVLIDSEPLWQRAEIEVFGGLGVTLTRAMCLQTRGLRVDEVVAYWFARSPWRGRSQVDVRDAVVARVRSLIECEGSAKPGVDHALALFAARGLPLGVASSSDYVLIEAVLARLGIAGAFRVVHSGEEERLGKPDPAIYRSAARKLGVTEERCLAIEDSPGGVASAKAAGLRCVAVLDTSGVDAAGLDAERARLASADVVIDSLLELDAGVLERVATSRCGEAPQ